MKTRGKGIARREALKGGIGVATVTGFAIGVESLLAHAIHTNARGVWDGSTNN